MSKHNQRQPRSGPQAETLIGAADDNPPEQRDPRQTVTRAEQSVLAEKRVTRIPIGRMQRLEGIASPYRDPAFYLRFVLDKPGRLDTHSRAGYEFVKDSNGKGVNYPSGSNQLNLMKLPIEFRVEDLKNREDDIAARLGQEIAIGREEYSPDGAKGALTEQGLYDPEA